MSEDDLVDFPFGKTEGTREQRHHLEVSSWNDLTSLVPYSYRVFLQKGFPIKEGTRNPMGLMSRIKKTWGFFNWLPPPEQNQGSISGKGLRRKQKRLTHNSIKIRNTYSWYLWRFLVTEWLLFLFMESCQQGTDILSRTNFSDSVRNMERNFPDALFDIFFNCITLILT